MVVFIFESTVDLEWVFHVYLHLISNQTTDVELCEQALFLKDCTRPGKDKNKKKKKKRKWGFSTKQHYVF